MTAQVPTPMYMRLALALATLLSAPSFIGLLTKTKVWCAITGRCEVGGASYPDLVLGALLNAAFLIVLYFVVVRRHPIFLVMFGAAFIMIFALMTVSFTLSPSATDQLLSTLDISFLLSALYMGLSMLAFGIRCVRLNRAASATQVENRG